MILKNIILLFILQVLMSSCANFYHKNNLKEYELSKLKYGLSWANIISKYGAPYESKFLEENFVLFYTFDQKKGNYYYCENIKLFFMWDENKKDYLLFNNKNDRTIASVDSQRRCNEIANKATQHNINMRNAFQGINGVLQQQRNNSAY